MKIFIRQYLFPTFGNLSTDQIEIPSNKITTSSLKLILFEKYQIPISEQKLTVKMANISLVTMTDEWPLSFFFIKHNSQIYLERIKPYNKAEEIMSLTKSKYLKSLGLINAPNSFNSTQRQKTNLFPIIESPNEYNDELFIQKKSSTLKTNNSIISSDDIKELLLLSIKNNNLLQLQELIEQYNQEYIKDIDMYLTESNGWNALHYASYHGYIEIANYLINSLKADVNYLNKEGFTPLHLAVFKDQEEMVKLLLNTNGINVNCFHNQFGTPLHLACKKRYFKIVSLLVASKADLKIRDINGKVPIEVCHDSTIKKLLSKLLINSCKLSSTSSSQTNSSTFGKDFPFLKNIEFMPPKPPKAIGYVEKIGNLLPIYRMRYLEVDPFVGTIKRYKSVRDYPRNPNEIIPLIGVTSCIKEYADNDSNITNINLQNKNTFYYFSVMYNSKEIYRVESNKACKKWIEIINSSVIYSKFWSKISKEYPNTADYLLKQQNDIIIINHHNGECKKHIHPLNKQKEKKSPPIKRMSTNQLLEDSTDNKGLTFNSFQILDVLGSGTFGKVFKATLKHSSDDKIYAMKVINKRYLIRNNQLKYAITECNVLKQTDSPFIVTLHFAFQTMENLYMILDYCPGGDLGFHLMSRLFEENEAKFYIGELILAIEHLHNLDIIYRDLKPENILIDSENHIKLADFGLAKERIAQGELSQSFCGSPAYLSPEMVTRKGVGKSADIYGIGAVLYEMISGTPPFYSNEIEKLYQNIKKSKLVLHNYFSDELKDLLKKLLCRDPKKRIGIYNKSEIKSHPFFKDLNWEKLGRKEITPPLNLVQIKIDEENNKNKGMNGIEEFMRKKQMDFKDVDYNEDNQTIRRIKNYTFLKENV